MYMYNSIWNYFKMYIFIYRCILASIFLYSSQPLNEINWLYVYKAIFGIKWCFIYT